MCNFKYNITRGDDMLSLVEIINILDGDKMTHKGEINVKK